MAECEGKLVWNKRKPKPFEIIYNDRGYLPLPGQLTYGKCCEIEGCKQGIKVAMTGNNIKSGKAESDSEKAAAGDAEEPKPNLDRR